MSNQHDPQDLQQRIGEVLLVLSDIAAGHYQSRCSQDLPVTHPLGALFIGVNSTIDALEAERARTTAAQRELEEKLTTIQSQAEVIHQLSLPIIEVWDRVLCLTVIGLLDADRSTYVISELLRVIIEKRAHHVILDVTAT